MNHKATLNGTLTSDGGEACDCGFEWGTTIAYGNTTPVQSGFRTGDSFSQIIENLLPNTTYHFRAFATNSAGTVYGSDMSFKTGIVAEFDILVRTDDATDITYKTATLNGTLVYDATEVCDVKFEYGTTVYYGLDTAWQPGMVTGDTFSAGINNLAINTIFHFRAVARNKYGVAYGKDKSFITLNPDASPSTVLDPALQLLMA